VPWTAWVATVIVRVRPLCIELTAAEINLCQISCTTSGAWIARVVADPEIVNGGAIYYECAMLGLSSVNVLPAISDSNKTAVYTTVRNFQKDSDDVHETYRHLVKYTLRMVTTSMILL